MSISFSGLVSGLDTSSWVEALLATKQQKVTSLQTQLSNYQSTKNVINDTKSSVTALRSALEKITDAKFGGNSDLFAKSTAKSSNEDIFTATVGTSARRQNYDITVQQLATFTKATSSEAASSVADNSTRLDNLGITKGKITAYVNGQKNEVVINEDDTLGDLKSRFAAFGVDVNVDENGVLSFSAHNEGETIHIGATTDDSNLVSLVGLERQEDGSYASTNSIFKASVASKLTDENAGFKQQISEGTFTIGNATFTIDEHTTLSSLISDINNNEEAQAYAYWDNATGKLSITSTKEGASYINIEAGTSNFTDVMGFTNGGRMLTEAQELGKNAQFTVNGTTITSTTNTVTSDISRIDGVTLTLKRVNTEEDGKTTLSVTQDTDQLKDAVKEFVTAYNSFMSKVDTVTANGAALHGETTLTSMKNTIRSFATGTNVNEGAFKMLSEIGVSVGTATAGNISTADTNTLIFDESKLEDALANDPESVKAILAGETGVFNMIENTVEQSLKSTVGFFDVKTKTVDSNITKMNDKIKKQNENIASYKTQLEKRFKAMEDMIASVRQNYNSFLTS